MKQSQPNNRQMATTKADIFEGNGGHDPLDMELLNLENGVSQVSNPFAAQVSPID
jgi:hypothetical protein